MSYDSGNLDVLVGLLQRTLATARDAYAAANRLETAQGTPGTADDAIAERKLTEALAELSALVGTQPQLPPKLTPADRALVEDAKALVANERWRSKPAQTLRKLLPMIDRSFV